MLTFIGILMIFFAAYILVANSLNKEKERGLLPVLGIGKKKAYLIMLLGLFIPFLSGIFFYAKPGTAYAVQYLWGGDDMVSTQGIKTKWWGRTIPITYEISIQDLNVEKDSLGKPLTELLDDHDGQYFRSSGKYEFADAIKADVALVVIATVDLHDEKKFLQMADRIKSEERLVNARIMPAIAATVKNTCKLMDAQDYIAGEAAAFDRYLQDQLMHGPYVLESYYEDEDTEILGDSTTVRKLKLGGSRSGKSKKYRIKYGSDGEPLRNLNSETLASYGITITQAQVTAIDWEDSFDLRLDLQKQEVAQTQLEKQQAQREFYRAQKEKAKGEAEKAIERALLEKEQIQQTIAAETEAKVATFNLVKEKKQLEVEKYKAQSKKVAADAQYYENSRLVSAGLTPQERAEWHYKEVDVISKNFSQMETPSIMMGSSGKGNPTEQLIQAAMAKQLIGDLTPKK